MLFTVVIPIFNSANYIARTLESVEAASTDLAYEIILIDDCSDDIDNLRKIIRPFSNIRLIEKKSKTNAANSRNIGFINSKSKYVFFLDSDDCFVPESIDRRISLHEESKAGIIFGNFITNFGKTKRQSMLPDYNLEDMRDYILIKKGDFRSSVISIDKDHYNNTLFDDASQKHQDWIFAFRCSDNKEKIKFDKNYNTIINVDRSTRMSSSMNIQASKYLYENYIDKTAHINGFSQNHWNNMINYKDSVACKFFISIYKPENISESMIFNFYKLLSSKAILPFSSKAITIIKNRRVK
jgi:glycosyltransferase involved in cell wall biosynthesis